ncbi:hypothetical protein [Candidatus Rhodoluna planktonica]|jgi:hypothetical protein|uniref:hypothetical protein n=1 Tax=Candidatus Rhodoluna planktonica TaxID=535712 RepID=UPI001314DA9E|nr:hypothetical protein [Candidatus Rhodoluna planktonica]
MNSVDLGIQQAITHLHLAVPDPLLWSGAAASSCAQALERLCQELQSLQIRLNQWAL